MGAGEYKRSRKERREIGERTSQRYREVLEEGQFLPPRKLCARCGETKDAVAFSVRKKRLKSGIVSENLESWCKECRRRDWHERRQRKEASGIDVRALKTASDRRWRENLSPKKREALRERMREAQAIQRRKEGDRVLGWRKGMQPLTEGERLRPGPIVDLLTEAFGLNGEAANQYENKGLGLLSELSGVPPRRIYGLMHGEYNRVALSTVDRLLVALGLPHMLAILYPET